MMYKEEGVQGIPVDQVVQQPEKGQYGSGRVGDYVPEVLKCPIEDMLGNEIIISGFEVQQSERYGGDYVVIFFMNTGPQAGDPEADVQWFVTCGGVVVRKTLDKLLAAGAFPVRGKIVKNEDNRFYELV